MHAFRMSKGRGLTALLAAGALTATATATVGTATTGSAATAKGPSSLSVTSFTNNFSTMTKLKGLAAAGKGKVAAILPDTTSSTRYVEFDAPDLSRAFSKAGLPASQVIVQNAQGSDTTQLTDAETDITHGATVLLVDPLDSGVGASIETYAKSHGVAVIDYDRLTLGGSRAYYVSFNNVTVGKVMGKGLVSCISAWHVTSPKVVVMHGATTDNNATLFAQGYNSVLTPRFKSGKWTLVTRTAGTWTAPVAESEFQNAYTAHPTINAALIPNDETAAPIITYLQTQQIAPKTFPTTGQDATLVGLQNILAGYQCGTVYKPIYLEAQAAASLALYLRAGQKPPKNLVNGKTKDTTANVTVPSVLTKPKWVTTANMNTTIIKDNFVPATQLCSGSYATDCKAAGITP
ncbi:MAG TPA: substrate-binding domain-containing protein [Acidimicrobiales bacterium]|nr:substrate-binding domain-containing protein [Acidimicrobiales bacterium]